MINKVISIVFGFCLVASISIAVALGVWALSLNTQLAQSRADYQTLKSSDVTMSGDYNKLNIESIKTQADLSAAQAQVVSLQDQLKKAQDENTALNTKITAIQGKVAILYTSEFGSETAIDAKVNGSGDDQLKTLWEAAKKTRSRVDNLNFWDYIIQSIATASGLSFSSYPVDMGALILPIA